MYKAVALQKEAKFTRDQEELPALSQGMPRSVRDSALDTWPGRETGRDGKKGRIEGEKRKRKEEKREMSFSTRT